MSTDQLLLATALAVPLLGSLALPLLGRVSEAARDAAALACVVVPLACVAALLPGVAGGATTTLAVGGLDLFHADRLATGMALVSLLVGAVIVFYSWGYIAHYGHRDEYYFMVVLFLGAMLGLVFSRHLLGLYLFWEITAIACWRLIGFFREPEHVRRADKAFLVTVFGAVTMLLGFVAVHAEAGTFDLGALHGRRVSDLAVGLMLVGILSKSATLPLHTWLPDAGVAPSPVTALLHAAVLVKIGVYVFARLLVATFDIGAIWHEVVPVIAAVSALVSAGAALVSTDLKRIIAYSTVSQLGFILLGLSVDSPMAVGGGLLYILMHSIAKGGLFLCAGIVEHQTHTKDLRKLGGLARTMPVTAASFALCALSVMGIPPFGGFFAKYLVIGGAFDGGQVAVGLTFVAGSFLTLLYLSRAFSAVFLGEPAAGEAAGERVAAGEAAGGARPAHPAREGTRGMVASVAALAALSLASGLLVRWPVALVRDTAQEIVRSVR
jgi:NADH:ubiquinone oxidoreductase subunit 5 (subunit L)/multisubunit Na+/H+ antiporter MnhA subunit